MVKCIQGWPWLQLEAARAWRERDPGASLGVSPNHPVVMDDHGLVLKPIETYGFETPPILENPHIRLGHDVFNHFLVEAVAKVYTSNCGMSLI